MDQGWTDRAHFSIQSPDRSTTNERWFDQNNLFDLIVDLIDTFQFAIKFPINLRHLLRRKFIKFCISKNLLVILLGYVKILRPIIRCSFSPKGIKIKNYHFQKMWFFWGRWRWFWWDRWSASDRIDDRDLIGIFVKDLIGYWIGKFIFVKDRDRSGKWKKTWSCPALRWMSIVLQAYWKTTDELFRKI